MTEPAPPATRRYPLWPLAVMALVALVDQIDVSVARGVLPVLEDEWGLSDTQLGATVSVFVFVSTLAAIPAGYVADHFRRTRVIGWTLLSWSGLILLSATAVNYVNLLVARALMGIGQAVDDPASTSYLADSYPARMRGPGLRLAAGQLLPGRSASASALGGVDRRACGAGGGPSPSVGVPGALVALAVFAPARAPPGRGRAARDHDAGRRSRPSRPARSTGCRAPRACRSPSSPGWPPPSW